MSIKNLFTDFRNNTRVMSDYDTEKGTFSDVESVRNASVIEIKQNTYVPQVNYNKPINFVRFGSAELFYEGALNKIIDYYPYDGSEAEKTEFYNKLLDGEKYIFDNLYPRFNGHALLSSEGWGALNGAKTSDDYGLPSTLEYITFKGGPNSTSNTADISTLTNNPYNNKYQSANIYDETIYTTAGLASDFGQGTRESNLKSNFDTGVTVEFWLKKAGFDNDKTGKEVIFDLWNGAASGSSDYGRLTIELTGGVAGSPFLISVQSGSKSPATLISTSSIGASITAASLTSWSHYAFSFYNNGSNFITKFYINGALNSTNTYTGNISEITSGSMYGRIGALLSSPTGSGASAGAGKLSASVDEFRFWKEARDSRQIALNYFTNTGGGTNTDVSNTTLGLYYKFNEGITGNNTTDSSVLDYSGRISNGVWTGYVSASRNTQSAIVLAGAAASEYKDPVVYSTHPDYTSLRTNLIDDGKAYDADNNSAFVNYAPSWVLDLHDDTENRNLKIISHIVGSYFDKMYLLAADLPKFKQLSYTSASHSPYPFASHLPTSLGMYVPDLFVDASILERLLDRNEDSNLEGKLVDAKNLIYQNLYNNLTNIYKAKGTEKAVRNVLRCFNLDDSLMQFKTYNKNATYDLSTNYKQEIVDKNAINFNKLQNFGAIVYQHKNTGDDNTSGFIKGSQATSGDSTGPETRLGFTVETDVVFPKYNINRLNYSRDFTTTSLFGLTTVNTGSTANKNGTATQFVGPALANSNGDQANFQVQLVKSDLNASSVYFKLTSSYHPFPLPVLTSSDFVDVYDNERWNLSVRVYPNWDDLNYAVSESDKNFKVSLRGINDILGTTKNSFEVTGTINYATGEQFLRSAKRVYVGAQRTNLTGTVINKSDAQIVNCRAWAKYINNDELDIHNFGRENSGISELYRNLSPLDTRNKNVDITNSQTLLLDWTFNNVTGSNAAGNFEVDDASSGSAQIRGAYSWLGDMTGYRHTGFGYGFATSSSDVYVNKKLNSFVFVDPEQVVSSDMINILSEDDEVFGTDQTVPTYVYSLEKNMYNAISSEILTFFAGAVDFNDIIGAPVNRYRGRYKDMEKLREIFFRKVTKTSDVEKFIEYYKWFDEAITTIVAQILPASSDNVQEMMNVIESHVLERNKYKTPFPTLETKGTNPEGVIYGRDESGYPYSVGFSPPPRSPRDTKIRSEYWKKRAERTASDISSGDATIDSHREIYRRVITSNPFLSSSLPNLYTGTALYQLDTFARRRFIKTHVYEAKKIDVIKGGSNFESNKNIQFALTSVHPAGPTTGSNGTFVPLNVLLSFMKDLTLVEKNNDPKPVTQKTKRHLKVLSGKEYQDGVGYSNLKSSVAFPFSIYETSVTTGYQKILTQRLTGANVTITNLHNDVYGEDLEKPMQGPFTDYAVGGHQSRHIKINKGSDTPTNRPEAWKLLIGTCTATIKSGAIGLVGADYPDPGTTLVGKNAYPYAQHQKAVYYRDMVAKRPVNIRNIRMTTGSTVLGNYSNTYEYVQTVGAFATPRHFVDNQPTLPPTAFQGNTKHATSIRTFMDTKRSTGGHSENVAEYSTAYLTGAANKSVIISRFSAPGGVEVMSRGYQDLRASEFSVYNSLNYRNMSVLRPSQGPSGTLSTTATNGDTTNIQVYDIHGKDYGLYSHLARHTARFGRDSLHETAPGTSYTELPGFHKIHRNNINRVKIIATRAIPVYGGLSLSNASSLKYSDRTHNQTLLHTNSAGELGVPGPSALMHQLTKSGGQFTWTGWMKFGNNDSQQESIFGLGHRNANTTFMTLRKLAGSIDGTDSNKFHLYVKTIANSSGLAGTQGNTIWRFYKSKPSLNTTTAWHHYAIVYNAPTDGTLGTSNDTLTNKVKMYIDGALALSESVSVSGYDYFNQKSGSTGTPVRGFSNSLRYGNEFMSIGGDCVQNSSIRGLTASIDEFTFWTTALTAEQIGTIYNSGTPCDIGGAITNGDLPATEDLWDWLRFETDADGEGHSYTKIGSTNNAVFNASDNMVRGYKGEAFVPMAKSGESNNEMLNQNNSSMGFPLVGCTSPLTRWDEPNTYATRSLNDNYHVQHQIPRSSKQYAWITRSLDTDNGWIGFTPTNFMVKKSHIGQTGDGYVEAYNLVSASDYGVYGNSTGYRWGRGNASNNTSVAPVTPSLTFGIKQSVNRENNTVGDSNLANARNAAMVGTLVSKASTLFNGLMWYRGNQHGFNSFNALRQVDNPIIKHERALNKISVVSKEGNDDSLITYDLQPVSNRGRPNLINFESERGSVYTIKATSENEKIYFSSVQMDNVYAPRLDSFQTPDMHIVEIAKSRGYNLNWFIYNQQLFPSIRNEFTSKASDKTGYNNKYWRDDRKERNKPNATYNTGPNHLTAPTGSYVSRNVFGYYVSQSAWPLDAPSDFLTRFGVGTDNTWDNVNWSVPVTGVFYSAGSPKPPASASPLKYNDVALTFNAAAPGELQNSYTFWRTGSYVTGNLWLDTGTTANNKNRALIRRRLGANIFFGYHGLRGGARYAYPHMLNSAFSTRSPNGPTLPYFGMSSSIVYKNQVSRSFALPNYAGTGQGILTPGGGEAMWEAGAGAGYFKMNASGTLEFISAPSEPWFNTYDDYNFDLKLMAKGFSILPEYRISENVSNYINSDEIDNPFQTLELEIPHVSGANTTSDGSFFISYSNSEFLKDFLKIKRETLLNAKEIRLSCTGAIRFNPYKGFYPVQRTLDLVSEFKNTYYHSIGAESIFGALAPSTSAFGNVWPRAGIYYPGTGAMDPTYVDDDHVTNAYAQQRFGAALGFGVAGGFIRPLCENLFSPGILYNSIKSGMGVSYPYVSDRNKITFHDFGRDETHNNNGVSSGSWALTCTTGSPGYAGGPGTIMPRAFLKDKSVFNRLPFETMLEPDKHINGKTFESLVAQPNGSMSQMSGTFNLSDLGTVYPQMARNFFGAVPSFFLKNGEFTSLKSDIKTDSFIFSGSETYMMRLTLQRSMQGARNYAQEIDGEGFNNVSGIQQERARYTAIGGKGFNMSASTYDAFRSFPLPQDPRYANSYVDRNASGSFISPENLFRETFTMYSRPSAFGPAVAGRLSPPSYFSTTDWLSGAVMHGLGDGGINPAYMGLVPLSQSTGGTALWTVSAATGAFDSFSGYNPAYTPPYYDGQAWCDIIFRPKGDRQYKIEDIIAESQTVFWRFDAGRLCVFQSASTEPGYGPAVHKQGLTRALIGDNLLSGSSRSPYGGDMINSSSMQLDSTLNLFGVEKVTFQERDKFGNLQSTRPGQSVGQRWVIRPKFETPMMNFNHYTASMTGFTLPSNFGAEQTARGMWHQFGRLPKESEGVFLSVGDIPNNWLKYHYDVVENDSAYNNYSASSIGEDVHKNAKSLADLVGFNKDEKVKLGQLKAKTTIREAIIAIPYITETSSETVTAGSVKSAARKKFISIPPERYEAAKTEAFGSAEGDSLDVAGPSISKQLQKMERYVLPPQLDFINSPETAPEPFVMYIFEFKYDLDRDDLSYIWQNIAPRDYKKIEFQHQSVAHELIDSEILNEEILEENENLRWMIFKVKQKAQDDYWNYVDEQAKGSTRTTVGDRDKKYKLRHNWPYDYVSFVEMAKMGVEIKFGDNSARKDFSSQSSLLRKVRSRRNTPRKVIPPSKILKADPSIVNRNTKAAEYFPDPPPVRSKAPKISGPIKVIETSSNPMTVDSGPFRSSVVTMTTSTGGKGGSY